MFSNELIRGTLKTIIMQLLSETDKMYGYELSKVVKERTKDKIVLTEGALYPILHKLEKDRLVTVTFEMVGNRTRKYYALTESGKNSSKVKRNELFDFMETLSAFMNPKTSVQCTH
ncbi:PadR family transcriptional regulator [Ekhidna sp.]|uniref:PadR family transcriptional regulator n=1 Tax=Ekhidna sp. TaxID=2608089 RepID=UPI003B50B84F